MPPPPLFLCRRCARSLARRPRVVRLQSSSAAGAGAPPTKKPAAPAAPAAPASAPADGDGAMTRRLREATEEALLTGGRAGRRAVEDAGFSDELKNRLLSKIADANFRAEYGSTVAAAGLDPANVAAGAGPAARAFAAPAQPWTGDEATEDTVLRMLDDARRKLPPGLRGKPKIPDPVVVDMRLRRPPPQSPGQRAASARDKATMYAGLERPARGASETKAKAAAAAADGLSESEREALRAEFRERFAPGARAMPTTFSGLAALANERIEDAIARGQFRSIPRGPGVERDTRADNPFIDTTEYIMNKMIQRQDIVPPWIEKQQELGRTAHRFRAQLRSDWRRHAARTLASRGGTLAEQMALAARYARAEQAHNPRRRDVEQISVPTNHTDDPVMAVRAPAGDDGTAAGAQAQADIDPTPPFRDPQWEAAERAYMELAVANLNALTRSYNLMAPALAKKPYFTLDRELHACYADVAPTLAEAIRDRAVQRTRAATGPGGGAGRRVLQRLVGDGSTQTARVYDNKAPHYGLKEMWRDFWKKAA